MILVNMIDPICKGFFLYCNVFDCCMHKLLRVSLKIEFFIKGA